LRLALRGLSAKIEDAHRQRRILIARYRRAEAQRTIAQTLSNLSASAPLSILERMESRVAAAEAEAEALADLAPVDTSLEAQFRALEAANVDDQLADLKRRMALAEPPRPRALNPAN
jgi:phage shock protein A